MERRFTRMLQANVGLIVLVAGIVMLLIAQTFSVTWAKISVDRVMAAIGAAIIFSGALQWLFDTFSKPQLFREVAERSLGNERLALSGLQGFYIDSKSIDYSELIANDEDLVVSVNYSTRLLDDYFEKLRNRVASGKNLTIIAMAKPSRGFSYVTSWDEQASHIAPSLEKIERRVREIAGENRGLVRLIRHVNVLSYSFVATKRIVWFKLYRNSVGPAIVPAFCAGHGSELFKFFWSDIECLRSEAWKDYEQRKY